MPSFKFTHKTVSALASDTGKRLYYSDTGCPGLQLMVSPAGAKSYRLHTRDKRLGKTITIVLGKFPHLPISTARDIVQTKREQIAAGRDIRKEAEDDRNELTFEEVFNQWLEHAKTYKKTWNEDEQRYNLYLKKPFGYKKVSDITKDAVERWRIALTRRKKERGKDSGNLSKSTINRAQSIISTVYNRMLPNLANPTAQVQKYMEKRRTVFLKTDHLQLFFRELNRNSTAQYFKDYLLLSLYTGARRSNVLAMRWSDVDLSLGLWIVRGEEMKNGEQMVVSLSDKEKDILERRKRTTLSIFVFPGNGKTGHYVEPKKAWKGFLKRAGLPLDYRLHDLRRTQGSWMAHTNASSDIIGVALGHKSKAATEHYVHLTMGPVAEAKQRALDAMEAVKKESEKVVVIRKKI